MKKGVRKSKRFLHLKRWHYALIILGILIALGIGVYAYGTLNPATSGHTLSEVSPPSGCAAGEVLQWSGSAWNCITPPNQLTRGAQVFSGYLVN